MVSLLELQLLCRRILLCRLGLCGRSLSLEALSVDNGGSALFVLLLADPHLLESGEGSENGSSDPDRVLSLGRSDDLDLDGRRRHVGVVLLHLGCSGTLRLCHFLLVVQSNVAELLLAVPN